MKAAVGGLPIFWWLVLLLVFLAGPAMAAGPYGARLSLGIEGRYSDNLFFDPDDAVEAYYALLRPQLNLFRLSERTRIDLSAHADMAYHRDHSALDATDYRLGGQLRHQCSERLEAGLEAGYTLDERRERELTESGLLFGDDRRRRWHGGFDGRYVLTERATAGLGYGYVDETFDTDRQFDSRGHQATLWLFQSLDRYLPRVTGRLHLSAGRYESMRRERAILWLTPWETADVVTDYRQAVDNYSATVGMAYAWTETLTGHIDLGGRWTRSADSVTQHIGPSSLDGDPVSRRTQRSESHGFVGTLALERTGERHWLSASVSHDLVPASGSNALTERTALVLSLGYRLSLLWRVDGDGRYYRNRSDGGPAARPVDQHSVQATVGISRQFDSHWRIGTRYRFVRIDDRQTGRDQTANSVMVLVEWEWSTRD